MKRSAAVLLILLAAGCARKHPGEGYFVPHKPSLTKLSNGAEIMILEDHEFPTVQMQVFIRGGTLHDPEGKEGLSSLAMQAVRLGGAEGRDPQGIEETLEFVGASLEMGATDEYFTASLSLLAKDLDSGLDILFDLLRKPALDPTRFGIVKERMRDALLRELEDPLRLAYREFPGIVYGPASPWGRKATAETVAPIKRDDVSGFCRRFFHPDRILVAVSGDVEEKDFVEKIRRRTEGWEKASEALPEIPSVEEAFSKEAVVYPRKDLTQSTIFVGHLGARRENPDKFPLMVMNFILGGSGSLTSRMGEEIRSNAGKAYGVWSSFGFGKDLGIFRAVAQTALENTGWVASKMSEMIGAMASSADVTGEETLKAKQAILRGLVFDFETRFAQVRDQARFHLWGYPDDYLVRFQEGIDAVTPEAIRRVAGQYLHPEGLKILIVTDEAKAGEVMKEIGPLAAPAPVTLRRLP